MQSRLFSEPLVKDAGALGWTEVGTAEAALIQRCAAGEQVACAELVASHERMVYQLALHLLGDRDEALDLSQEVFLRVFRTLPSFRGQAALRTWIYRICHQPGAQSPALVAPAAARRSGAARTARARARRSAATGRRRRPRSRLRAQRAGEPTLGRARQPALRSAHRRSCCGRSTASATTRSPSRWTWPSARSNLA